MSIEKLTTTIRLRIMDSKNRASCAELAGPDMRRGPGSRKATISTGKQRSTARERREAADWANQRK